jgi:predicted  nucleic acid-binding Zn-ribbon protein
MGILNRDELEHTQRQITKLELALDEMKREESPRAYEIMSQGFIAQIEQMRREIDEYLPKGSETDSAKYNSIKRLKTEPNALREN